MLRKETVSSATLELLEDLMQDEYLNDFFLVGGTALSLQIGHRISIDIDLFTQKPFDENKLVSYLEARKKFKLSYLDKNTIKGSIQNIQVDLITHAYPLVKDIILSECIRMASLEDIAAMKLNAIICNGTRLKDFVDVAYLSSFLSLEQMRTAYKIKYEARNPLLILKALAYQDDINFKEPLHIIGGTYKWEAIANRLNEMIKSPGKTFSAL